jgi:hypothetical protein
MILLNLYRLNRQNAWQLLKMCAGTALVFLKIFPGRQYWRSKKNKVIEKAK